jgi:hypothetical protein
MQRYFKVKSGREDMVVRTAQRACHKYVRDMIYEARLQAHIDYYKSIKKEPLVKDGAKKVTLTKEQYLQLCQLSFEI